MAQNLEWCQNQHVLGGTAIWHYCLHHMRCVHSKMTFDMYSILLAQHGVLTNSFYQIQDSELLLKNWQTKVRKERRIYTLYNIIYLYINYRYVCVSDTLTSRSRDMHGQLDCSHCRFRHLQGGWYRKTDGTKLGDMIDQGFLWDARIKVGAARHWPANIIGAWHQIIKCSKVGQRRATQDRSFCLAPVFGPPLRSSMSKFSKWHWHGMLGSGWSDWT